MPDLNGAYARVKRANQHISNLKRRETAYIRKHKDRLVFNVEPDTGRVKLQWLGSEAVIPALFNILVGEVIYNLRAALDYLIYELAILDSGTVQNGTQFPICDDKRDFDGRRATRLKGLSGAHVTAIERLQPYCGCTWTGLLRDVSNPDKHRELSILQGLITGKFKIFVGTQAELRELDWTDNSIPTTELPLGGKIEIKPGEEAYVEGNLALYIAFSDGLPVIETLKSLQSSVSLTLDTFKPEF